MDSSATSWQACRRRPIRTGYAVPAPRPAFGHRRRTYRLDVEAAALSLNTTEYDRRQVDKAIELVELGGVVKVGHLYLAASSDGSTRYQVAVTGECSCIAAMYGRRCYHSLAVRIAEAV